MSPPPLTRRTLLRRGAAGLLAASSAATAGCVETLPPLGSRVQYGRVDAPDADRPGYRRWLPAASALPEDLDPGFLNYATPGHLGAEVVGAANPEPAFFQKLYLDYFGYGWEQYDRVVGMHSFASTYVLEGDVVPDTVAETFLDSGYEETDGYAGYRLFHRDDAPRTAAVADGVIVWARHAESRAVVEAVVDAERGEGPRLVDTDDAFAVATSAIGGRPWIHVGGLGVDPTGESLVTSLSYDFDEGGVYYLLHTVYPEGTTVSERAVKDALDDDGRSRDARAVDVSVDGRVVTVEMHQSHEAAPTAYGDTPVPQITWGVATDGEAVTVTHEAGDDAPAEALTLVVDDGDDRTPTEAQFADVTDRVAGGDSVTVTVPDTASLYGRFSPPGATRAADFPLLERS